MPPIPSFAGRNRPCVPTPGAGNRLHLSAASGAVSMDAAGHAAVLWLVLRGQVDVSACEGEFVLGPGDWISLTGDSAPRALGRAGTLLLGVGVAPGVAVESGLLFPARGRMPPRARGQALRIWRSCGAFDGAAMLDAPDEVPAFLAALQADLADRIGRCPGHSERRKRQVLLRMQRARLCLEGQVDGGLRIGELAQRIHFSPWYFSKLFQALYGIGPLQFSARMRLERARRLLATTAMPVTEVSAACGFDNPCSFARAFRARFGTTASDYRLRHARGGDAAVACAWSVR